jgi:GTP-binding protein
MRAGILVHLVEPMPMDQSDPIGNYKAIRKELEEYSDELAKRPEILVVTKSELPNANEVRDALAELVGREDVMIVSAVTGQGLNQLVTRISELLALQKTQAV